MSYSVLYTNCASSQYTFERLLYTGIVSSYRFPMGWKDPAFMKPSAQWKRKFSNMKQINIQLQIAISAIKEKYAVQGKRIWRGWFTPLSWKICPLLQWELTWVTQETGTTSPHASMKLPGRWATTGLKGNPLVCQSHSWLTSPSSFSWLL